MRILHLFDHSIPMHDGYAFRSRSILLEQRRRGWETAHVTSPKHVMDGPALEEVDGLAFHRSAPAPSFAAAPVARELAEVHQSAVKLEEVARAFRPDALHAHSPVLNALAAERVAKKLGLPWIYEIRAFWEDAAAANGTGTEGSFKHKATHALETRAIRNADGVATICDGLYEDIVRRRGDAARVVKIPNAVNADEFAPLPRDEALAASLGLADKKVIGFLGSFYPYEGLDILIDALPLIKQRKPGAAVLLVGGGQDDEKLRAKADSSPAKDSIVFTGRVPHGEVARYYSLVDILAFPRRALRLTELVTPLKPLEAMASRKLVLASDIGGHREFVRDGETGVLFKPDSAEALADAVCGLLDREAEWEGFRDAGRRFVETERTWANSVANYEALFEAMDLLRKAA